jgi:hypothetical protein
MTRANETDCYNKRQDGLITYNVTTNGTVGGAYGNFCHIDCSNRGVCDYKSGTCTCFEGYYGTNCNINDALAGNTIDPFAINEETFAQLEL